MIVKLINTNANNINKIALSNEIIPCANGIYKSIKVKHVNIGLILPANSEIIKKAIVIIPAII